MNLPALQAETYTSASECPWSDREREVIRWMAEGKTAAEIAVILGISTWTVQRHIANAMQGIGRNKDTALVATAIRSGWIR